MWLIPISRSAEPDKTQLRVGRLTKAHGLKGAIKIELYTDDPARRFVPGAVFTLQVPTSSPWHGKTIELVELKWYNSHAVAFFKDVPDRSTAESLIKAILWIDHDLAETSDEEDAWFDHHLVGLAVMRDGVKVGTITLVDHLPAQDLLHVETPNGEVLVPFVKAIVPVVDVAGGTVTVTPPAGLFEELPDEPVAEAEADAEADAEAEPQADVTAEPNDDTTTN
ncbi:ribosome maturation factor RimM [Salinibacterium hongtaonis]|uniref:ribosome maturation factor RimM n=1 Tax=Homoserinimonas hongtaonis TaxID=2079791 RepID=UPI000D35F7B2|nr:ribosome maturation factor RimM [Salinibacterium hongtaonis]AWB89617.1 ribosome maturation factor RimM [Salinibacterium hongtaonis]